MTDHVTSAQVVDATGATYRQIDYWVRKGFLRPYDRARRGSGFPRTWPREELRVAQHMARLVAAGLPPEAAHKAARDGGDLAPGVRVVVDS